MRWLIRRHPAGTAAATKSSSSPTCQSLLGLADNPADLLGYGPIPAALVRDRAAEADWLRLVVDPVTGHLLDYGTVTYRPPAELADYVMARDRRCRFPGCNTRATICDIDHNIPAPRGDTSAKPTAAACAGATTGSKPSAAGPSNSNPTAAVCGHHHAAANSSPTHHPNSTESRELTG